MDTHSQDTNKQEQKEDMVHPHAHTNSAPLTTNQRMNFFFKKKLNDLGELVKRPTVILDVPIPTYDGLLHDVSNNAKVAEFLLELVADAVKNRVRDMLADDEKPLQGQSDLNLNEISLTYIANIPKSERAGGSISKETWEAFERDYTTVMIDPANPARSKTAAKLFVNKFSTCKTDKKVLSLLQIRLAEWFSKTPEADDFSDVYKYLDDRLTSLLTVNVELSDVI